MEHTADIGINFGKVREEAEKEMREERMKEAKTKFKTKLKEVQNARIVLKNAERELAELEHELSEGL